MYGKYLELKEKEKELKKEILALEVEIVKTLKQKPEGAITQEVDGYKVTITNRINRTFSQEKWEEIKNEIPEHLRPVKEKLVLDEKGFKWLRDNEPAVWSSVCEAVTEKTGKPSLKVERI